MELRRKAYEALRAENQRLKSQQVTTPLSFCLSLWALSGHELPSFQFYPYNGVFCLHVCAGEWLNCLLFSVCNALDKGKAKDTNQRKLTQRRGMLLERGSSHSFFILILESDSCDK